MDAFNALVSDIIYSINDALNARGGEVSNLALSLINRARSYLWGYAAWDLFRKEAEISIDSDLVGTLPADFGRVLRITSDEDTEYPVWAENDPNEDYRYRIKTSVSITTGLSPELQFYGDAVGSTMWLRYMQLCPNCTDNAHYLFFPAELVLRCARWLRSVDRHDNANDVKIQEDAFQKCLTDYRQFYHCNDRPRPQFNRDYYGESISNSSINMLGDIN